MEPGQRAYEAWATHWGQMGPWSSLKDDFRAAWASVEAACVPQASGQRVRHVKRGTTYVVVGVAEAQVSTPTNSTTIRDYDRLVVYRGEDGRLWCRFEDEFNDGRFEAVEAACVPAMPDVAALVERLERPFVGTYADGTPLTIKPTEVDRLAASAIKAQAAEIVRLTETHTDENGTVWAPPTAWAYAAVCIARSRWQARAEEAEAKLREAVEVMRLSHEVLHQLTAIIPGNDSALVDTTHAMARLRAILAAAEKPASE